MIWVCRACNAAVFGRFAGDAMPAAASRSLSWAKFSESGTPTNILHDVVELLPVGELAGAAHQQAHRHGAGQFAQRIVVRVMPVKRKSINPHHIIARK